MKLTKSELENRLKNLNGWVYSETSDAIVKEFKFKDFREAMAFVLRVAFEAEKLDHHPDIFISYNRVNLSLRTHSENGVTEKDFKIAEKIDKIE
ncbi:4a-hydroxytetrahydrobiopterin dehydratase [Candidatus Kryptobacter tengchongensis]|uniref:4a-hydroxytetrahydrobiopterin dehydratase n=1 Tax=Kryptobacter tengchongensis TaxID=1643429 RepID=UPI000707EB48|nr:4a-hydroxytetrahydrobiopterin dehydratase [Candidatus Kryptobacter tengchongensis]CUS87749.1 4a-hydroxytetrahydrobiopterin dehydratase [Candidatus Kryptobacter tengchongensis]